MAIPFFYTLRNLRSRRLTTTLTAAGMALVVFVFAATLMLVEGLRQTLVETGSPQNAVVIREGAETEVQSGIERPQAAAVENRPEVATGAAGRPLLAKELVVLITLPKKASGKPGNVVIRGIDANSLALRPQVRLAAGRLPRPGSTEIAVGLGIADGFAGAGLGGALRFAQREWTVVGVLAAGRTGFSSEIWGDRDQLMQAFRRSAFSSLLLRLRTPGDLVSLRAYLQGDPRLTMEAKGEVRFYADQSQAMATFLRILGLTLTAVFSLGAILGAMITMYAAVAGRTIEIGTLRALGFRRGSILVAFIGESLLLGLLGGGGGLLLASAMQLLTISTTNWQTFAELSFGFDLTWIIALQSLAFALFMGFAGGLLPAVRAARLGVVEALRTR
ncbi:MAG: ABC transporter permease [Desulfuromonadales bacterium]|jgi:ABC-type lipoprotein release transport system permease subunit